MVILKQLVKYKIDLEKVSQFLQRLRDMRWERLNKEMEEIMRSTIKQLIKAKVFLRQKKNLMRKGLKMSRKDGKQKQKQALSFEMLNES